ncbi:hypothetical protein RJ639_041667 [Escallonia herrerae]|uniref:Sugar transporter n=1 Tax=Escallonia herrerae TaxID=1293975 RepID=A0AA88WI96_9ASTE|nr:hypothetical protein RJ639_041667 [Escallonia herrerae]
MDCPIYKKEKKERRDVWERAKRRQFSKKENKEKERAMNAEHTSTWSDFDSSSSVASIRDSARKNTLEDLAYCSSLIIGGGWGWRLSLGLAGIPAGLVTIGGKAVLRKIGGTDYIEPEFLKLVEASRVAKQVKHPFRNLSIFQQFTGINAILFYAPLLFNTLGFGSDATLYSTVITGAVNVLSTIVSIFSVDKLGRRVLLLRWRPDVLGPTSYSPWSWGPLGWLIPSETFPLETRSAGQSVTVCVNLLFTFVIAQAFLSMLCHFKYGIFLFFSGWVFIMSIFVWFLFPETKNIPIEEMTERVWKQHWLWKRFMDDNVGGDNAMSGNGEKKNGHANGADPVSQFGIDPNMAGLLENLNCARMGLEAVIRLGWSSFRPPEFVRSL